MMSCNDPSPEPIAKTDRYPLHCKSNTWVEVLDEDTTDAKLLEAQSHLDKCRACQQKLEDELQSQSKLLSNAWWHDAKDSWLEEEVPQTYRRDVPWVTVEFGSELPKGAQVETERISLSFLSPPSHPEMIGRVGKFEIERFIGKGGMGIVLKAYDTELHRVVALKFLAEHLAANGAARRRFARESQAAAAVIHPNVIPIHNVETSGKLPFLVMQYVQGESLQSKIDRDGPISVDEFLRIGKQISAGLGAAHAQGLVHRDVKPANILLEGNVDRVVLSDFGLARAVDDASLTCTGFVAGTPHYMSPEQANGESIHLSSDLFSLGSVLYFMLAGRPPFRGENAMGILNRICHERHRPIRELRSDVPIEITSLVDRLLHKSSAQRHQNALEVEKEIDDLMVKLQAGKLRLGTSKRRLFAKRLGVGLLLTLLGGVGSFVSFRLWKTGWLNSPTASYSQSYETHGATSADFAPVPYLPAAPEQQRPTYVSEAYQHIQQLKEEDAAMDQAIRILGSDIDRLNVAPTEMREPSIRYSIEMFFNETHGINQALDRFDQQYR